MSAGLSSSNARATLNRTGRSATAMHDSSTPPPPCPLAHEPDGTPIVLPAGASAWRVRRHTGGRPRLLLDAQKQPVRLSLTYTAADLEEILPPGTYRLDLVDQRGEQLGLSVPITIGQAEEDDDEEAGDEGGETVPSMTLALPPSTSDTRLVLEANIRATQMAFQHNQRTLEMGLRMAETLRDGVHVLVQAQAEVMKSMSTARGFFRNAAPQVMLAPPEPARRAPAREQETEEEDEEEEEEPYEAAAQSAGWVENLKPLVEIVTQQIIAAVMGMKGGGGSGGGGIKLSEMVDWRRAALSAGEGEKKTEEAKAPAPSLKEQISDPAAMQHVIAVLAKLTPDERKMAQGLANELSDAQRAQWFQQLRALSVEKAVEEVRVILGDLATKPAA